MKNSRRNRWFGFISPPIAPCGLIFCLKAGKGLNPFSKKDSPP